MKTDVELIFLPYGEETLSTMVDVLIRELKDTRWTSFTAAVAFARRSGNIREHDVEQKAAYDRTVEIYQTYWREVS